MKLKAGHYWAAIDHRGRQIWGGTKQEVQRVCKAGFKMTQRPKK